MRGYRGGQSATEDAQKLARYEDIGYSSESYLRLDGWEFGMTGYLGNVMMPNSHFNPYLTAAFGSVSWEQTAAGRGTEVIVVGPQPPRGQRPGRAVRPGHRVPDVPRLRPGVRMGLALLHDRGRRTSGPTRTTPGHNTHAWTLSLGLT